MIGEKLKYSLDIRKMTQRELAEKIGITEATLSRYINNTRSPQVTTIIKICKALGISADWLLGLM